jgi:hypothetical protein
MGCRYFPFVWIGRKQIRVIAQTADIHAVSLGEIEDADGVEAADVDVSNARVSAFGFARRPTHQLYTGVSSCSTQREYLLEREIRDNRADKAELHDIRF